MTVAGEKDRRALVCAVASVECAVVEEVRVGVEAEAEVEVVTMAVVVWEAVDRAAQVAPVVRGRVDGAGAESVREMGATAEAGTQLDGTRVGRLNSGSTTMAPVAVAGCCRSAVGTVRSADDSIGGSIADSDVADAAPVTQAEVDTDGDVEAHTVVAAGWGMEAWLMAIGKTEVAGNAAECICGPDMTRGGLRISGGGKGAIELICDGACCREAEPGLRPRPRAGPAEKAEDASLEKDTTEGKA